MSSWLARFASMLVALWLRRPSISQRKVAGERATMAGLIRVHPHPGFAIERTLPHHGAVAHLQTSDFARMQDGTQGRGRMDS